VRDLVVALEDAVIGYAAELGISRSGSREAPGVYVDGAKLASIGLRIRRGASYHGLALNVALDLEPFQRINVCGYPGLAVTRLADLCGASDLAAARTASNRICCRSSAPCGAAAHSAISTAACRRSARDRCVELRVLALRGTR
jgi:lipoate-protein ligase B